MLGTRGVVPVRSTILPTCALAALLTMTAQAHTQLLQATPADGSTVESPPRQLRLVFSEAASLTALSIRKAGDATEKKIAPLPKQAAATFLIDLPPLTAGGYLVKWRALSDDNHLASGSIRFTLQAH